MEIARERFEECRQKAEEIYQNIGEIWCPYLKEKVIFNAKGLEHLKLKEYGKPRSVIDQYMRLRLIEVAPPVF